MGFSEVPLGELVRKCATWSPKVSGSEKFDYIDLSSVDKGKKEVTAIEQLLCSEAPSRARQLVKENDVLVATVRPNLNGVAIVGKEHDGMTASTGYCVLRPIPEKLNPRFLFHWVKTGIFVKRMVNVASGANYPAVSDAKVKASTIPFPPLVEQERIAAILDQADTLRGNRREAVEQLDTLLKSTFFDMFGDPITNPHNFPMRTLSEFYINKKEGTKCGPFGSALKKGELVTSGIPVWNMDNIDSTGRMVLPFRMWITDDKFQKLESYSVVNGDVLISRAGTVGKMCVAAMGGERSIISTNLIRVRFGADLLPIYFVSLMTYCKGRVGRLKTGPDGAFTHMSTGVLDKIKFPYPSIDLQYRFAAIVESAEQQKALMCAHLAELDALFASLQHRAFNGEL